MYNYSFDEYYNISGDELKAKICSILENLSFFYPDEFSPDLLGHITPQQDSITFLQNLTNLVPIVQKVEKNFEIVTEIEALRMCAIGLDSYRYTKMLEPILLKLIGFTFANQLLGLRYTIATEIIEKKLKEDLKYNSQLLYEKLMELGDSEDDKVIESLLAGEEIARVCNNESVKDFYWNAVWNFENAVESYVKKGLPNIVLEMFARIFYEAVIANANLIDEPTEAEQPMTSKDKKNLLQILFKIARNSTNYRLGIKHGGVREKEGFNWNQSQQIEFYKTVESIPKIDRKKNGVKENIYLWDYIYEQFNSRGVEAKKMMKAEAGCSSISPELLDEAFVKWQKCEDSYTNVGKEDSPKMFLFRHALQLLDYPNGYFNKRENKIIAYKKATLQKHYDGGEKALIDSDKQDETCLSENASGIELSKF